MAPNLPGSTTTTFINASTAPLVTSPETAAKKKAKHVEKEDEPYRVRLVWRNILGFIYMHIAAVYGIYLVIFEAKFLTFFWAFLVVCMGALGVTAGAHRLWSHRAYKANWPFRFILAVFQTMAFQNCIWEWTRDHRVHHKFSDTDADPHNASRGFFFSHMGWLMCRKHPDVRRKGKTVDMSDIEKDPIVMFQKKTYLIVMPLFCFVIPCWIPYALWNEDPWTSWYVVGMFRYTLSLQVAWLVNSAAHLWGNKPFDKSTSGNENKGVAIFAFGEGWHNYHHVFPWDYKAAELGTYSQNYTTMFIDFFAWLGWAYDLKSVPVELIKRRAVRTGDGTYQPPGDHHHLQDGEKAIWGWGDKDMPVEDTQAAIREGREL